MSKSNNKKDVIFKTIVGIFFGLFFGGVFYWLMGTHIFFSISAHKLLFSSINLFSFIFIIFVLYSSISSKIRIDSKTIIILIMILSFLLLVYFFPFGLYVKMKNTEGNQLQSDSSKIIHIVDLEKPIHEQLNKIYNINDFSGVNITIDYKNQYFNDYMKINNINKLLEFINKIGIDQNKWISLNDNGIYLLKNLNDNSSNINKIEIILIKEKQE